MKWFMAQDANGEPAINVREEDEDLSRGFSLLREMAPEWQLREIAPGVWYQDKQLPPVDRDGVL